MGLTARAVLAVAVSVSAASAQRCTVLHGVGGQDIRVEPHGANALRVRAVPSGLPFRDDLVSGLVAPSDGVVATGPCLEHALGGSDARGPGSVTTNGNIRATLGTDGRFVFTRVADGKILLAERIPRVLAPTTTAPALPGFYSLDLDFAAVEGERIYGLGQHKHGQLDNKGVGPIDLAPRNTEILIPVAHSSEGYAFLFNLPSFGAVEYGTNSSMWHADTVVQADFWVATTADAPPHAVSPWAQLQGSYANATGHAPVYPEWTSGFWQCKNRYHNQSQLMDVAAGYLDRGHPLQLMIIDYYSWAPDPLGDETLPAQCWPNPKEMVDQLKAQGVELMISPYFHAVSSGSKYYADAKTRGFLARTTDGDVATGYDGAAIYDVFVPEARAYAFNAVNEGYIKPYGLHHWWLDCDEPCGANPNLLYNNGTWPSSFVGAAYPHMLDLMVYEGMGAPGTLYPDDNVMLSRSAWAGSQRYGSAVWSGDTSSTFSDLNQQFRAGLNIVMSGIPYWTTDIGGYNGGNISDPGFRELIVRWFQWGAVCPIFRNHGRRDGGAHPPDDSGPCGRTGASNEIWEFGNESEAAIARAMRLRDQLRPYVMAQYRLAATDGAPVMRPLFYDFWEDRTAQRVDDQLMFGPLYLVAPQLHEQATSRSVYLPQLPAGELWSNLFTLAQYNTTAGSLNITEATPLTGDGFGTFPIYRRHPATPYLPPSPPPTPIPLPLPKCDVTCVVAPGTERATGGRMTQHFNSSDTAECCAKCVADPACHAWVWGKDQYTSGPETCFILGTTVASVRAASGRSYGCVRK